VPQHAGPLSDSRTATQIHYVRNATWSFIVFVAAYGLVFVPEYFDLYITRAVNGLVSKNLIIDRVFFHLDKSFIFSGVLLAALIWGLWFSDVTTDIRTRLLVGTLVSFPAGIISRFLQHKLPTHPRPLYDPALEFHTSAAFGPFPLNTWNSFPSDHVAVFAGLVTTIYLTNRKVGAAAICWTVLVESSRTYVGAHYPSDLIGGAALAAFIVWAAQAPLVLGTVRPILDWERQNPFAFYVCAFLLTYQIATLFIDVRDMTGGFSLFS